jgi:hypothetical protein
MTEIEQLKQEIEFEESDLETARKYPTETTQYYRALSKQEARLDEKKRRLAQLEKPTHDQLEPKVYPQRTKQQNKALHVLYRLLADNLNDAGLDMRKTLKPSIEIPWNPVSVKEFLWRPIQEAQLGKQSTTELTTVEIDEIFNTINRHLGEKFGLHVPFPSIDELIIQYETLEKLKKDDTI